MSLLVNEEIEPFLQGRPKLSGAGQRNVVPTAIGHGFYD